jgi:NhaA family Na+:H+ antiporter
VPSILQALVEGPRRIFVPQRAVRAAQAFVRVEASSGIVLLVAAVAALVWANSPASESYDDLWHAVISIDLQVAAVSEDLRHWVNDGLMTVFFFLVGLEIKRELVHGELSTPRRAILPAAAALGGMIGPALIYVAFNAGGSGIDGWGIPMATDIAFALGVLSLLSGRIPFGVKVFLLALAIADDIGAILVIAVFYTADLNLEALSIAALIFGAMVAMSRAGVRSVDAYVAVGAALWLAVFESGIHATLAGVALGLLTPARPFYGPLGFVAAAEGLVARFRQGQETGNADEQQSALAQLEDLSHGTESPLDRLERRLHPWVSYGIVPLFALANAGVAIDSGTIGDAIESSVSQGVALGLLLGKPVGIVLFTFVAVKLRLGDLPNGARWSHILGVGLLGGIGFTVSLLITGLAFEEGALVDEAKLGVLAASALAGAIGFVYLWLVSRPTTTANDSV